MKKCNSEQKFYGTKENFEIFLKTYGFRQIDKHFKGGENVFVDEHANLVRAYAPNCMQRAKGIEVWWRYIPYDRSTCVTNAGYKLVNINHKQYTMHQIVARTWLYNEEPDSYTDIDHIDGDKLNNDVSNLRWCTKKENMYNYHMQKNARIANGEIGVANFIKQLKQEVIQEYKPEKKLVLNLKLAHPVKKKEEEKKVMNKDEEKAKIVELFWNDDCSDEELEREMKAIQDYLKTLKGEKDNGEEK